MTRKSTANAWVFCSSGSRALYLEDIVRALALPESQIIRFRYKKEYVSPRFVECTKNQSLIGSTGYITYLDKQSPEAGYATMLPLREVKVIKSRLVGSSFIIDLEISGFVKFVGDINPLETEFTKGNALDSPPMVSDSGSDSRSISGNFVYPIAKKLSEDFIVRSSDGQNRYIKTFEDLVTRLEKFETDFPDDRYRFFTAANIEPVFGNNLLPELNTRSGKSYNLSLYHYTSRTIPNPRNSTFSCKLSSLDSDIQFGIHNQKRLETEYDLTDFEISIDKNSMLRKFDISIDLINQRAGSTQTSVSSSTLVIKNRPSFYLVGLTIIGITLGLIITQIPRIKAPVDGEGWSVGWQIAIVTAGSFIAALSAVLGIKKSI